MRLTSISVAALAGMAAAAKDERTFAVLRFLNKQLTTVRIDPIVNPGVVSPHVHTVFGSSGFNMNTTVADLDSAKCSTAMVKGDNSVYWVPTLYFRDDQTGKFESVEVFYGQVYYFFEPTNDDIKAFPKGLKIFTGDTSARTPPAFGPATNLDPSKGPVNNVKFTCPRDNNNFNNPPSWPASSDGSTAGIRDPVNLGEGVGFPDVSCDGYASPLRMDVHMPSCYNPAAGLDNYRENMAFPTDAGNGKADCPKGWIHLPHLFYEVYWDTLAFKGRWQENQGHQPFFWSNGDNTGYSAHADFIAGWDQDLLQHIIDTCNTGTGGMDTCPGLFYGLNSGDCTIPPAVDEVTTGVLDALPGNNPPSGWTYGSVAPVAHDSPAPSASASMAPAPASPPKASSQLPAPSPPLPPPSHPAPPSAPTPASPTKASSQVAAPSPPLPPPSHPAPPSAPPSRSPSPYPSPSPSAPSPSRPPAQSTPALPTSHEGGKTRTITVTNVVTNVVTVTETVTAVQCGVSSTGEPTAAPTQTSPTGEQTTAPTPTSPTGEQTSAPTSAPTSTSVPGSGSDPTTIDGFRRVGCFQDFNAPVLWGEIAPDLGPMTNAKCIARCKSDGFSLAGTEGGGICFCGNELDYTIKMDDSACAIPCQGDASDICGGGHALNLYSADGQASMASAKRRSDGGHTRQRRRHRF